MIFNPYTMQNTMNNAYSHPVMNPETVIQPVIQPVIQQVVKTVYQPQPVTRVLEPIINEPIMANGNHPYGDYSQYSQVHTNLLPVTRTNETSEFQFNNNDFVAKQTQTQTQSREVSPSPQSPQISPKSEKQKKPIVNKPKSKKGLYTLLAISTLIMLGVAAVIILLFTGVIVI